jgi:mannose-1-phosphate guanylyltransferase
MLHPVVMAGGSGTRFWPRSRRRSPKQLIRIFGEGSMIQQTVQRLQTSFPPESFLVLTNIAQAEEVRRQLPQLSAAQVVAEPVGRDNAACIGLAALILLDQDPNAAMLLVASDQIISPTEEFTRCVAEAERIALRQHALVTFGVKPSFPSEQYGYVRRGERLPGDPTRDAPPAFRLAQFKEKPSQAQAEEFIRTGEYYWNICNFVWRAADILEAIRQRLPELHAGLEKIRPAIGTARQEQVVAREYPALTRISIDYGVMEKATNAVVVEMALVWDDLGSWDALSRHHDPDEQGNVVMALHAGIDTRGCILAAEPDHLIATLGVKDLIVVQTPDATLVCDRSRAAEVKALVELLRARGLDAYIE